MNRSQRVGALLCLGLGPMLFAGCTNSESAAKELEAKGVKVARNLRDEITTIHFGEHAPSDAELAKMCGVAGILELSLSGKQITAQGWDALQSCKTLHTVRITDLAADSEAIQALSKVTSLTSVDLSGNADLSDQTLAPLKSLAKLTALKLAGTAITDSGLSMLSGMSGLTTLDVSSTAVSQSGLATIVAAAPALQNLSLNSSRIDAPAAPLLVELKKLTHLSLRECHLTDASLQPLLQCSGLKVLDVGQNPELTDSAILLLGTLPQLVTLDVSESKFTGVGFNGAGFKNLSSLKANGTAVTDVAIPDFQISTMYSLSLLRTAVTEAAIREVFATNHQTAVTFGK